MDLLDPKCDLTFFIYPSWCFTRRDPGVDVRDGKISRAKSGLPRSIFPISLMKSSPSPECLPLYVQPLTTDPVNDLPRVKKKIEEKAYLRGTVLYPVILTLQRIMASALGLTKLPSMPSRIPAM